MSTKPLHRKAYGSIPHLSTSNAVDGSDHYIDLGTEKLMTATQKKDKKLWVHVSEKYDGSCVAVAKVDGKILALTKKGYLAESSPYQQHHLFHEYVKMHYAEFNTFIEEGERIVGEWMIQAHGTRYAIEPNYPPFVAFDVFRADNSRYLSNHIYAKIEALRGMRIVAEPFKAWFHDHPPPFADPEIFFNRFCRVGRSFSKQIAAKNATPEGLVFKIEDYKAGKVLAIAKYVRPGYERMKFIHDEATHGPVWNECDFLKTMQVL